MLFKMKHLKILLAGSGLALILFPARVTAQDEPEKEENKPEITWDVQRHFDEEGNLFRYDSSYSWSWSDHDFGAFEFDSLMENFFGDFHRYDSAFPDFYHARPHPFMFPGFPDSIFMSPFDHPFFPEGFPEFFGDGFMGPFGEWDFGEQMWERHGEWLEHYLRNHPLQGDSLHHFRKQDFQPPGQKKSWREVEI
jgi:hypothetical protein